MPRILKSTAHSSFVKSISCAKNAQAMSRQLELPPARALVVQFP
jgi:hypothetical protein